VKIKAYDHVGLRVLDRVRPRASYKTLGFRLDDAHSSETALEIVNEAGVRLNLIPNGEPAPHGENGLVDRAEKWPGHTHAAFIVEHLSEILVWADTENVSITEGPVDCVCVSGGQANLGR
jgi:lactoylglutathione lyase